MNLKQIRGSRVPLNLRATCVPRLLDDLHPLVAVALLLGSQLQRLLSIVTKHDEEVVLRREREIRQERRIKGSQDGTNTLSLQMTCCGSHR